LPPARNLATVELELSLSFLKMWKSVEPGPWIGSQGRSLPLK